MTTPTAETGFSPEQQPITIRGFCLLYTDQSAPGRHLAFYDKSVEPKGSEELSFAGLRFLKAGDKLKILSKDSQNPGDDKKVVWEGDISAEHELASHDRFKSWVKGDPTGERAKWIDYFFKEYPAELTTEE